MKKVFIMAIALMISTMTFAKKSDALKAILDSKNYSEAENVLKTNFDQLASNEEKANAYNYLVDLAVKVFNKQFEEKLASQINKVEFDETLMSEMAYNAISASIECYKYDKEPKENGKTKMDISKKNAERLWIDARNQMVEAGQTAAHKHDDALTVKYWGTYIEMLNSPLFEEQKNSIDKLEEQVKENQYNIIGQVGYFAGVSAQKLGDLAKAREYFEAAAYNNYVDKEIKDAAYNSILALMREGLKDKADTLRVLNEYKEMYAKAPEDDLLMNAIYNMYSEMKDKSSMKSLLDERLARDPNNFIALANKGLLAIDENDVNNAIKYLEQARKVDESNAVVLQYLGVCYNSKASETAETDKAKAKEIYKTAVDILDKCKQLDPDKLNSKWGYYRWQAYYNYYGPDAPETKQAEADSK